jgi:hypothetical protein
MKKCGTGAWVRSAAMMLLTASAVLASGCGGGGEGGSASSSTAATAPVTGAAQPETRTPANTPPSITASPASEVKAGSPYALTPTAQDPDGDALAFSVENRPAWAEFSTVTGELRGTPNPGQAGKYENITISVSDGKTTAALAPFSVTVAVANGNANGKGVTLHWEVPMQASDGSALGDLAGFRIHYGKSKGVLVHTIEVQSPGLATYVIDDLPPGTYYFAVRAVATTGAQSPLSNVISKAVKS